MGAAGAAAVPASWLAVLCLCPGSALVPPPTPPPPLSAGNKLFQSTFIKIINPDSSLIQVRPGSKRCHLRHSPLSPHLSDLLPCKAFSEPNFL